MYEHTCWFLLQHRHDRATRLSPSIKLAIPLTLPIFRMGLRQELQPYLCAWSWVFISSVAQKLIRIYLLLGRSSLERSRVGHVNACHKGDENGAGLESAIAILTETQC